MPSFPSQKQWLPEAQRATYFLAFVESKRLTERQFWSLLWLNHLWWLWSPQRNYLGQVILFGDVPILELNMVARRFVGILLTGSLNSKITQVGLRKFGWPIRGNPQQQSGRECNWLWWGSFYYVFCCFCWLPELWNAEAWRFLLFFLPSFSPLFSFLIEA